jgi:flagellar motor switch protein FliG
MSEDAKTVKQIRAELKNQIYDEMENLPEHLKKLSTKDRLDILIKLMPYALPKSDKINATYGEPLDSEW